MVRSSNLKAAPLVGSETICIIAGPDKGELSFITASPLLLIAEELFLKAAEEDVVCGVAIIMVILLCDGLRLF